MDRPQHIDLPLNDSRAPSSAGSRSDLPSPRIQHLDGDIPPSLSPLDAFAAHSRKLAKELEETRIAGQRRMSRLPPQVVTQSLSRHQASRPAIFRSLSNFAQDTIPSIPQFDPEDVGNSPLITAPKFRPISSHPRLSAIHGANDRLRSQTSTPFDGTTDTPQLPSHDYFGATRAESPEPIEPEPRNTLHDSVIRQDEGNLADGFPALAPPNAAFARSRLYNESSDDDYTSSNADSFFSQTRKLSTSSNVSLPLGSSVIHQRSSSNNSTSSLSGHKKTPSHLNFSRPRSSASSYSKADSPTKFHSRLVRKASQTSDSSRVQTSFDDVRSVMSDGMLAGGSANHPNSRFVLPRGRAVDRTSGVFTNPPTPHLDWHDTRSPASPVFSETFHDSPVTPLDQSSREHTSTRLATEGFSFELDREDQMANDEIKSQPSPLLRSVRSNLSAHAQLSTPFGAQKAPNLPPIPGSTYGSILDGQSQSSRSNSTIRPSTARTVSNYASLTPDDHVTKAIDLHQHGDLKESTYHLRIAAKHNHPTGMLLYALACRHGWGMRTNHKEGVAWLKKAVDSTMLEVAEDENENSNRPKSDFVQRKEHRAQFALAIYELGVSHLNGWGIEQDKALALRCFEIAGHWGDPDALSEAGFCYSKGIGCKKDLNKGAKFYRMAAKKGVSMVGNSWIYKEKYNDPDDATRKDDQDRGRISDSPKKGSSSAGRSKSKTRSIFGRKKSIATATA